LSKYVFIIKLFFLPYLLSVKRTTERKEELTREIKLFGTATQIQ